MSRSLNKVMLIGNIGRDPEAKETVNGGLIATFSLATQEQWVGRDGQKKEAVDWHNCTAFGKTAEVVRDYLKKGTRVYVEGKLKTDEWSDKQGQQRKATKVQVFQVIMLGSQAQAQAPQQQQQMGQWASASQPARAQQPQQPPHPAYGRQQRQAPPPPPVYDPNGYPSDLDDPNAEIPF